MKALPVEEAKKILDQLVNDVAADHQPVTIQGAASCAVLLHEDDWNAVQETLYLLSVPGLRESVREGLATPVEDCAPEPGWRNGRWCSPKMR